MKFVLVLAVAVACASADVSHVLTDEASAAVIDSKLDVKPDGSFQYAYETSNGISSEASGFIENPNSEYPSQAVRGSYRYFSDDGKPIEVTYVADSEGFKPSGSHLPVAPPIPEAIARSIAYNAARAATVPARAVAPPIPEAIARRIAYNAARAADDEEIPVPGSVFAAPARAAANVLLG